MTEPARSTDAAPEPEEVDGLPVLDTREPRAELTPVDRLAEVVLATPARQVAALAASGFVAGAATVALVAQHKRQVARRRIGRRPASTRASLGEVVSSGSFLVDVHLLRRD